MTLQDLFKKRKIFQIDNFQAVVGPHGYVRYDGTSLGVVVDINSTQRLRRVEKILAGEGQKSPYILTNDGEYLFRLDFSDTNRALALIGLRSKGQRE